ncbi:hypothetical protein P692DRAFT_20880446 [Suillus brevipes Sb2]|nr:hypothetical protein P692DRAFT_20880446 [Suillus brevipes Sb2]
MAQYGAYSLGEGLSSGYQPRAIAWQLKTSDPGPLEREAHLKGYIRNVLQDIDTEALSGYTRATAILGWKRSTDVMIAVLHERCFCPSSNVSCFAFSAFRSPVSAVPAVFGLTINTPANVVECQPILFSWTGGQAPYYLTLVPGMSSRAGNQWPHLRAIIFTPQQSSGDIFEQIKSFPTQTGTSYTWNVDLQANTILWQYRSQGHYFELALEQLMVDFPYAPKPYLREQLQKQGHADTFTDSSLRDLTERIVPLGTYYTAISSFVESRSHLDFGLVNHALCAAIRDMLKINFLHRSGVILSNRSHRCGLNRRQLPGDVPCTSTPSSSSGDCELHFSCLSS